MYDKKVRRRRVVLVVLVALCVLLVTVSFGGVSSIQRGALEVFAPIQEGASRALKPVRDLFSWVGDTFDAKDELDKVKAERDSLRRDAIDAERAKRENAELRALVRLNETADLQAMRPVSGRVIARSPTVWYSTINVNVGSDDGVEEDQPVVTGQGLVGRVTEVSPGAAQVTLVTDEGSAVSAVVNTTGVNGLVRPAIGDPDDLLLDFLPRGAKVEKGDAIVTAGSREQELGSLFPAGIPIGKVTRVSPDEVDVYQRVHIEPYADLRKLDFVQVLTEAPAGERADAGVGGVGGP